MYKRQILSLDIAVSIQNQLVGKARAAGVGHAVVVAVNHVLEVVDHGLGEHERLLPLREENGLGLELIGSGNGLSDIHKVVKIHQYVVVEMCIRDRYISIFAFARIIVFCSSLSKPLSNPEREI